MMDPSALKYWTLPLTALGFHLLLSGAVLTGLEKILLMGSWRLPGTDIDTLNRRPREFRRVLARFFVRWGLGFAVGLAVLSFLIAFLKNRGVYSFSLWAMPLLLGAFWEVKSLLALARSYPEEVGP